MAFTGCFFVQTKSSLYPSWMSPLHPSLHPYSVSFSSSSETLLLNLTCVSLPRLLPTSYVSSSSLMAALHYLSTVKTHLIYQLCTSRIYTLRLRKLSVISAEYLQRYKRFTKLGVHNHFYESPRGSRAGILIKLERAVEGTEIGPNDAAINLKRSTVYPN